MAAEMAARAATEPLRDLSLKEGETTVGRPDLGTLDVKVALTVHREHATFTCGPHSVTMVSRGKNPTGIRRSGDASWRWLAMRDQAELLLESDADDHHVVTARSRAVRERVASRMLALARRRLLIPCS